MIGLCAMYTDQVNSHQEVTQVYYLKAPRLVVFFSISHLSRFTAIILFILYSGGG